MKYGRFLVALVLILVLVIAPACQKAIPTTQTTPPVTTTPPAAAGVPGINVPPVTDISPRNVGTVVKTNVTAAEYVVTAWNDLGMHCVNPTYDAAVILPPYNNVLAQVVKRGNPPQIVTQGIRVEYRFVNNTSSYNKSTFGQFWDNAKLLFGIELEKDKGLNLSQPDVHNGLAGSMVAVTDHFEAIGIPLTPVDDSNIWNPYQVAEITVKDAGGRTIAQTRAMVPVSDEMSCSKCHGADAFNDILRKHDARNGTKLIEQKPVLCAACHGDPALGSTNAGAAGYLSGVVHSFHAGVNPAPGCYDCHPGQVTKCARSLSHTTADGNCIACHGDSAEVGDSIAQGRIPWVDEPDCLKCHSGVSEVDTGEKLYRNATGHGGMYCTSCHSSPHSWVPTSEPADNYQAIQYQGKAVPMGSCAACHPSNRGDREFREYLEHHGGRNPEDADGCYICHTSVNTADTTLWPHSFQWKAR